MNKDNPIITYSALTLPPRLNRRQIKIYGDGRVEIKTGISPEVLKELRIPPEQAMSYVERLVQAGFFDFKDKYKSPFLVFDGGGESMTVNYQGKSKKVSWQSTGSPSPELRHIVRELEELVEEGNDGMRK